MSAPCKYDHYHPALLAEVRTNGRTYRIYDDGTYHDGRGLRHLPNGWLEKYLAKKGDISQGDAK